MANLQEVVSWEAGIYQLETGDPVLGGPGGVSNKQGQALTNRTAYLKKHVDDIKGGNTAAGKADKLSTARNIALAGDVTGQTAFDGSGNITITATYKNSGVVAGTYRSVTVDAKGNITAGTNPTTLAGYGITDAIPNTQKGVVNGVATLDSSGKVTPSQLSSATETVLGMMKVATQLQVDAGTEDDVAVTPKKLKAALKAMGVTEFGPALIGVPIDWPLAQMPQDIWPDCGMVFLSCAGQSFNKATYPLAAQLYPSGVMLELRAEFIRGWDNGRGVDAGRQLLSYQAATQLPSIYTYATSATTGILVTPPVNSYQGTYPIDKTATDYESPTTGSGQYFSTQQGLTPTGNAGLSTFRVRSRSVAFHKIMRVG